MDGGWRDRPAFGRLGYETLPDEQLTKSAIAWGLIEAPEKVVTL